MRVLRWFIAGSLLFAVVAPPHAVAATPPADTTVDRETADSESSLDDGSESDTSDSGSSTSAPTGDPKASSAKTSSAGALGRRDGIGTSTSASSSLRAEIPIDTTKRSVCTLPRAKDRPGVVTLALEGLAWNDWGSFCEQLVKFLRADKLPFTDQLARESERLLSSTKYFASVRCTITSTGTQLGCAMSPELIVRDVSIDGSLPFVLLKEDIQRQVTLRPGVVLPERKAIDAQTKRIEKYMSRQGFFDSKVEMVEEPLPDGAEPNQAIRMRAKVRAGKDVVIRNINVEGRGPATKDEIESTFFHNWVFSAFPRRFTPESFDSDIGDLIKLLKKRDYPEARVKSGYNLDLANGAVDLSLQISLGPLLFLHFEGNRALDDGDLKDLATFTEAGSSDAVEIDHTAKRIRDAYQHKGYFIVEVKPRVAQAATHPHGTANAKDTKDITFLINEGPRAEVSLVTIAGNKAFPADQIASEAPIKTKGSGFLYTGRWVDIRIDKDLKSIARFYRLRGYEAVSVSVDRAIIDNGKMEVKFRVHEGPYKVVSKVAIEGAPREVTPDMLKKKLRLLDGKPFVKGRLESDRRAMLTLLAAYGYPRAHVARKMKMPYKTDGGDVSIRYEITPGRHSTFGGALVRGNFRTSKGVIDEELSLKPGDPLDLVAIGEAKQRLRQLGVFNSVQLQPLDTWKTSTATWLLVDVQERDARAVDGVIGFRSDDFFSVGADLRDNNFVGRAVRLDLSARLSNASQVATDARIGRADRLLAKITAPHPLGAPFNIAYTGDYHYEDKPRYRLKELGASTSLFRTVLKRTACSICPTVITSLVYRLTSSDLTLPLDSPLAARLAAQGQDARLRSFLAIPNQTIGRIGPKLTFDRVDSPIDPHSGYSGDITLELASPLFAGPLNGANPFWRLLGTLDGYVNLGTPLSIELSESTSIGGPVVWAVGTRYGQARQLKSGEPVPLTETFFYGGDLSVRGVEERASNVAFFGANFLWFGSTELRWYFLQTSFGAFQLAALTDAASASYELRDLFKSPTVSVGSALRFVTPVGPISFAYAFPIVRPVEIVAADPNAMPKTGRLHFSFGYTF